MSRCLLTFSLALGPICFFAAAERMPALPTLRGPAAAAYLKQQGTYDSLSEAVEAAMYGIRSDQLGFGAPNAKHGFVSRFSAAGLEIDGVGWQSSWQLRSVGYGERQISVSPARLEADGTRIKLRRGAGVTEWYVNSARGLEQGFTLERPPGERRTGEKLRLTMEVAGDLTAREAGEGVELVRSDGSVALRYEHLVVKDSKGRELASQMGAAKGVIWVEVEDSGAVWPVTVDPTFAQQAYLKASNTEAGDDFGGFGAVSGGTSVAVSGDTVVVGAAYESSNATGVNGNQLNNSAEGSGAAYVFVRSGATWSQQAYLKASNTGVGDDFGVAVGISGDTVVVGAQYESSAAQSGAAYVFVRNGVAWSQQAFLKASNNGVDIEFGNAVAVSGDTVVVGAYNESGGATQSGAAYVFVRNGISWSQQAYLKASNNLRFISFGTSVAVSGETVVVGAPYEGSFDQNTVTQSGAAYVFVRNGVTWSQQVYLKASNPGAFTSFGHSVGVSGDTVVVGSYAEASNATGVNGNQLNNGATASGAAYVFVRNGATWSQQAYLKASNTGAGDKFGYSVAVSGDTVVAGAPNEGSNATGVNGDQANDNAFASGAAYVFVRNGVTWSQQAYLKASNTGGFDAFGIVAVSGDTVVAGAPSEDSNAKGVNGNQSDNSADGAGAAYVFFDPSVRITDIRSITDFGDVPNFTSGSWLQIKGVNLAATTRIWQDSDFNGDNSPTMLDGISVAFNGTLGFMYFTKPDDESGPSQINVLAPGNLGDGPVNVVVTNPQGVSNTFTIQKAALAPGMLSPPKFNVGGKQYLVASYGANYFFVGNENLLPGAPFLPAKPGDVLYVYGVGFGDTTPFFAQGVIPRVLAPLNAQVKFQFGPVLVTPYYAGYYPNFIGLDLFGLVVPDVPDGDHLITVLVNGQALAQTLYLTVKR